MAIGKLLSPWLLRRRPERRDGSAGHSQTGKAAALRPPLLRRPPQEAERQSQLDKNRPIERCGKVAKLPLAGEPVEAMGAAARRGEDSGKLRQQDRKLISERPRRVDRDEAACGEPAWLARGDAEFGAQNFRDFTIAQAPRQRIGRGAVLDWVPEEIMPLAHLRCAAASVAGSRAKSAASS